ncbi:MAG: hypothetical protein H6Q70_2951 [Firmicutes bacterium]|nr:hypothetical protein [Bacillota bacterium]
MNLVGVFTFIGNIKNSRIDGDVSFGYNNVAKKETPLGSRCFVQFFWLWILIETAPSFILRRRCFCM